MVLKRKRRPFFPVFASPTMIMSSGGGVQDTNLRRQTKSQLKVSKRLVLCVLFSVRRQNAFEHLIRIFRFLVIQLDVVNDKTLFPTNVVYTTDRSFLTYQLTMALHVETS